jgi:hypothetical protein
MRKLISSQVSAGEQPEFSENLLEVFVNDRPALGSIPGAPDYLCR